jgi:hypothetical protein
VATEAFEGLVLRDKSGDTRGGIGAYDSSMASVELIDVKANGRVSLEASHGGRLLIRSKDRDRVSLNSDSAGRAELELGGPKPSGEVRLVADDTIAAVTVGSGGSPLGAMSTLFADATQAVLQVDDPAGYRSILGSTQLTNAATGITVKRSAASLVMFDKDKQQIWQAP